MMKLTRALAAAALIATTLGACSRSEPEAPPLDNYAGDNVEALDAPAAVEPAPAPLDTATPAPDLNATAELPPEEAAQPDEQMLDDASATGMTARAQRDTDAAEQPAEQKRN
jgi:hypothetical protein